MGKEVITPGMVREILKSVCKDKEGIRAVAKRLGLHHSSIQYVIRKHEQSIDEFETAANMIVHKYPELFIQKENKIAA